MRYLIYHLRWQLSALVMIFPMYLFQDKMSMPIWSSLMASQFVGALIFYLIDKRIFAEKESKVLIQSNFGE